MYPAAARIAELETVPVRVVKLTDAEATEARVAENLQREDIHPLAEALGFKSLLELAEPYNIGYLAARARKARRASTVAFGLLTSSHLGPMPS